MSSDISSTSPAFESNWSAWASIRRWMLAALVVPCALLSSCIGEEPAVEEGYKFSAGDLAAAGYEITEGWTTQRKDDTGQWVDSFDFRNYFSFGHRSVVDNCWVDDLRIVDRDTGEVIGDVRPPICFEEEGNLWIGYIGPEDLE